MIHHEHLRAIRTTIGTEDTYNGEEDRIAGVFDKLLCIRRRYHVRNSLHFFFHCIDNLPADFVDELYKIINDDFDLQERVISQRPQIVLKLLTNPRKNTGILENEITLLCQ